MALTVTAIKTTRPAAKAYKLVDEKGMHLLVRPNGSKLWQLRYRHEGKEKTASLGQYPDVSLAAARERRDQLRKHIATGADPVATKRVEKAAKAVAQANNFEAVAREWWESWKAARTDHYAVYVIRRLEQNVFPMIGTRPVSAIEARELVVMAKAVQERGALDIARRCLQMCNYICLLHDEDFDLSMHGLWQRPTLHA